MGYGRKSIQAVGTFVNTIWSVMIFEGTTALQGATRHVHVSRGEGQPIPHS